METSMQETKPKDSKSPIVSKIAELGDSVGETYGSLVDSSGVSMSGVGARQSGEGTVTKSIESVTSKVPSATFLSAAFASIGVSAALHLMGRKEDAQFVGQWVPTILIMGLYNKLVKLEGSE
jgi:hypothetical protein